MYKIIKHKWDDRNKLFFSSDWHNFHEAMAWDVPIWKGRGYSSPEESWQDVINKINARVGEHDTIYYLGDSFLNVKDDLDVEDWFAKIKCQNIMYLMGNHESTPYRIYKQQVKEQYGLDDVEVYPLKWKNVTFLGNHQEILVGKKVIVLNHFPISSHHHAGRGSWGLFGHTHGNYEQTLPQYPIGKRLDMSWDVKNDIWSFDEIYDVMSTKTVEVLDHAR